MSDQLRVSISYETKIDPELLEKVEKVVESDKIGVTIADVKRALNINRSTAKRYLEALVSLGKVKKERRGAIILYYKSNIQ
jgi:CitB family two-component system response regulator CitT